MRRILTSLMFIASVYSFAQVGVSKNAADTPRATLDVRAMGEATPDGILIPNVDKNRAQTMSKPEDSTLAYITSTGAGGDRTTDVDADGFYYFKGAKWVKLGSGVASSTSATVPFLGPVKGRIRSVALPVTSEAWSSDDFALVVSGEGSIGLPNPANNTGRIVAVNNQATAARNFVDNAPLNMNTIDAGSGMLIMCDGHNWYVIGGLY